MAQARDRRRGFARTSGVTGNDSSSHPDGGSDYPWSARRQPWMNVNTENWPRPHRLTVAEYYRMAEVGLLSPDDRVELIEGEIVDMPPIGSRHAAVVTVLAKRLIQSVGDSADVRIQAPVRLGPRSEPQPDIALLAPRADCYRAGHPQAGDVWLLIEVSESTLRFDREVKSRLYARHGVPEYWVVDLVEDLVHLYRDPDGGRYREQQQASTGVVAVPGVHVEIDVESLF